MKRTRADWLKQLSKSSFFIFFAIALTCGSASPIFAEQGHAEHYEGDGHQHGNLASQLNNEGIALYRAKDYKAALEKFEQAAAEAPNVGEIHAMLGKVQVKLEKFEEAVVTLKKSLELSKNTTVNRLTHKSLARGYIGLGKFEEAKKEIELYKEMCTAQNKLTPKTEKIISDLYDQLK